MDITLHSAIENCQFLWELKPQQRTSVQLLLTTLAKQKPNPKKQNQGHVTMGIHALTEKMHYDSVKSVRNLIKLAVDNRLLLRIKKTLDHQWIFTFNEFAFDGWTNPDWDADTREEISRQYCEWLDARGQQKSDTHQKEDLDPKREELFPKREDSVHKPVLLESLEYKDNATDSDSRESSSGSLENEVKEEIPTTVPNGANKELEVKHSIHDFTDMVITYAQIDGYKVLEVDKSDAWLGGITVTLDKDVLEEHVEWWNLKNLILDGSKIVIGDTVTWLKQSNSTNSEECSDVNSAGLLTDSELTETNSKMIQDSRHF